MNTLRSEFVANFSDFLRHMRRRWYLYLPVFAVWSFAYARVFIDPTPRVPVLFNWTPSLPYSVALVHYGPQALRRGDFIVFAFAGEAQTAYPGLHGQPFFKIVRGLPGDTVTVVGRIVAVNGEAVGTAKTHAFDRRPLDRTRGPLRRGGVRLRPAVHRCCRRGVRGRGRRDATGCGDVRTQ